jgi:hypothetical protein
MRALIKWIFFLASCLVLPISSLAQTTLVTGTVTDPNGIPYAGATLKAQLTLAGANVTGQPVVTVSIQAQCISAGMGNAPCKIPFQGTFGPVTLDSSGNIPGGGIVLQDNTLVTPASTQWTFTIDSPGIPPPQGFGPQTFTSAITISGASQSISTTLNAAALAQGASLGRGGISIVTVPFSATPNFAYTSGSTETSFSIQLTGNVTSSTISGSFVGGSDAQLIICQDATGSRTFAFPPGFLNVPTISATANSCTAGTWVFCGTVGGAACPATSWQNTDISPAGGFNQGVAVIDPLTFGVKADGHAVPDASTTITSNIVTCPNLDCNFLTTAVVGQRVFANKGFNGCTAGAYIIPASTTITSIDSDSQIHVSNNASVTCTALARLVWGDVDQNTTGTGPWQTAWNAFILALNHGPALLKIPCSLSLIDAGIGGGSDAHGIYIPTIAGCGPSTSILAVTADYSWTAVSIGANNTELFGFSSPGSFVAQPYTHDFVVDGSGENTNCPASAKTLLNLSNQSYLATNVYANNLCPINGNLLCFNLGSTSVYINLQSDFCGQPCMALVAGGQPTNLYQLFCGDSNQGMAITGAGTVNSYGSSWGASGGCGQGLPVGNGGAIIFNSYGDNISATVNMAAGSRFNGEGDFIAATNCGAGNGAFTFSGVATVALKDSRVTPSGTTTLDFVGTGTVIDQGGNTFTPGTVGVGTAGSLTLQADGHSLKGTCTGVGTAASTLGLYGTGPNVTLTTCTSAAIGTGMAMSGPRTLLGLFVTATAAGTNAASGVVTVLVNGAASTITCTIGTGTSCADGLHTVAVNDGDLVSIRFTTQAADTLAGVKAIVEWQ